MQIKIKDKKSNIYYINNPKNFNELVLLVNKYDRCYPGQINSKKYSYLKEWINKSLPKLSNKKYSLSTKLYWIFNNLNDFPYCSICHKQNGYKLKNVKTILFGYYSECSKLCAAKSEKRNQKIINTNIDRYGCKNVFLNDNIKRKIKTTLKSRYGVEIPLLSSKILNKSLNTKFELYGDPTFNNRNKAAKTCIEKYGTPNPMLNSGINKKSHSKYYFNNINFDSAPELAIYIYLIDHNIDFEYLPNTNMWYMFNNTKHRYLVDFKVNNEYWEVKGDHMISEDGSWICPWNHLNDEQFKAKYKCAIENNVKIITSSEYLKYLEYISIKYGKNYLQQFKK